MVIVIVSVSFWIPWLTTTCVHFQKILWSFIIKKNKNVDVGLLFEILRKMNIALLLWVGLYLGEMMIELWLYQLAPYWLYNGESRHVDTAGAKDSMNCNPCCTGSRLYVSRPHMDMAANSKQATSALFPLLYTMFTTRRPTHIVVTDSIFLCGVTWVQWKMYVKLIRSAVERQHDIITG